MARWPQQMLVTGGEGRGRLTAVEALEDGGGERMDLCALARETVSLLSAIGHVEPSEVQLQLPAGPVFARVHPHSMEQVMLHLLSDAVSLRRAVEQPARAVRLSVEPQDDFGDYGPSIQMRYVGRAAAAPDTGPQGLSVARELVEAQGGQLAVKHHGHTGTTITVTVGPPDAGSASW